MRKFLFISLLISTLLSYAESISNVRALQEGNNIVLLYDLSSNIRVTQVNIITNNHHRVIPSHCLSGDIHKGVFAGTDRRIVYDVLADYPDGLQAEVAFMIFTVEHLSSQPQSQPEPQLTEIVLDSKPNTLPDSPVESVPVPEIVQTPPAPPTQPVAPTQPAAPVPPKKMTPTHRAVDLGLSVKWAAYNVGANTPLATGDYFAWGETDSKDSYLQSNYTATQFEDAAAAQWGDNWRIPTIAEWKELQEHCIWKWGQLDGIYGYKITSKKNGNAIFLPAAGWKEGDSTNEKNHSGYYWVELIHPDDPYYARCLYFEVDKQVLIVNRQCFTGRCLRAVCP